MHGLSENEIKKKTLQFLKAHYRYRQREGVTTLSSDMRGAGGIIADGYLSFPKPGGEIFHATFEATSLDTKNEVRYTLRKALLNWDGVAVSSLLAAAILVAGNIAFVFTFKTITPLGCVGVYLLSFLVLYLLYISLFRRMRRYRYIYAVEQFKQYFVDEQWIAIGEDVFANYYDDHYYVELRRQCIRNGFGLIVVREHGPLLMQITPSRTDLFKSRRKRLRLFSQAELARITSESNYPEWMRQFNAANFMRFKSRFRYQAALLSISVLMFFGVLYLETQKKDVVTEEEQAYLKRMAVTQALNNRAENMQDSSFVVDTPYVWPPPILREKDTRPYIDLAPQEPVAEAASAAASAKRRRQPDFLLSTPGSEPMAVYDCSRLRNITGQAYVLQEGVYPSYTAAETRILSLSQYALECSALWLGCFEGKDDGYVVFFGPLYEKQEEALKALHAYETQLGDNVLGIRIDIRTLSLNVLK
ncbi:MAG: hypothetical protein KDC66_06520 [Phaeodactylibacter sp.]|nr:hypothetical protein [Phaeodactylibacter sp.]MCB9274339.1 hypothetical protein [Lewinellaceae bacterium]